MVARQTEVLLSLPIIRLFLSFKKIRQDWEETDDELDSAASLICDEDLPVSDGEDFIETIR